MSKLAYVFLWLAALAIAAPHSLAAQTDVIRGRVTNSEGLPLMNVRVTATSIPGSVTREVRTNDKGQYQIAFAGGPGDYIMGFALIGLGILVLTMGFQVPGGALIGAGIVGVMPRARALLSKAIDKIPGLPSKGDA